MSKPSAPRKVGEKEALAVGKTVTLEAYPSTANANELRAERITVDGKTIELR